VKTTAQTGPSWRKGDWIRFQLKAPRTILEGFLQEIADGRIRVGKAPDSPENAWFDLAEITLLKQQRR
jgi:hypothetical protein